MVLENKHISLSPPHTHTHTQNSPTKNALIVPDVNLRFQRPVNKQKFMPQGK